MWINIYPVCECPCPSHGSCVPGFGNSPSLLTLCISFGKPLTSCFFLSSLCVCRVWIFAVNGCVSSPTPRELCTIDDVKKSTASSASLHYIYKNNKYVYIKIINKYIY